MIVTHSPVVGRLSIPKRGYNYNHGTRRGPLTSGPNVHQGRVNGQRGERLRAGHPKVNDLTNNNNHVRFSETEFRRHKLEEEQRNNANGIRNYKRQHGSRPNIRVHPIDSYRRRQRQKQYRGTKQTFTFK